MTKKVDVWVLACVLYETLKGESFLMVFLINVIEGG
jgi:hypothetical protein